MKETDNMNTPSGTTNTGNVNRGGLTDFGDELPKKVGPFHRGELETIARRCTVRLGIDWEKLPIVEKKAKLAIAVDILTGKLPVKQLEDQRSAGISGETRTYGLMLLEEFKNSPKWDIDEFNRGYVVDEAPGSVTQHTADVGGVEHSER